MTMNTPPRTPREKGSPTRRPPAAAIAASTALPPERRTRIAAWVASGSTVAAAPRVPTALGVLAGAGTWAPAGNAATSDMRTARTARPAMRDMKAPPRTCGPPTPGAAGSFGGRRVPHVQVVVVMDQRRDDPARPAQVQWRADEDPHGARAHEAVDELLGGAAVDLGGTEGGALEPVAARVVDVGVEPGLVREVPEPAVAGAEEAAVRPREVPDQHARGVGVGVVVLAQDELDALDRLGRAPAPPPAVGRALEHRVPGHEVEGAGRQLHAVAQAGLAGGRRRAPRRPARPPAARGDAPPPRPRPLPPPPLRWTLLGERADPFVEVVGAEAGLPQ